MKKFFAVAVATVMTLAMSVSAFAGLVTEDKTYDGSVKADGTAGWASGATGETFAITDKAVTIVFENDAFTRDTSNWSNFIIETIATEKAAGWTGRADAHSWTYGDNTDNIPVWDCKTSWGAERVAGVATADEGWDTFPSIFGDTTVTLVAKKTGDKTVEFKLTSKADANAYETYTLTYPNGVPADLSFQVGADGGVVTLVSATYEKDTPATGDFTAVLPVALVAVAAMAVVVVMKKRTVAE